MDPKSSSTQTSMQTPFDAGTDAGGEGNYDATRRYNAGVEKSVKKGDAEELAEEAKKALEGPEGEELRKAEKEGKQGGNKPVAK